MIIMNCRHGLANRLFYFAHCIALAEATGHRVLTSNIPEYSRYYGGKHGVFCTWPQTSFLGFPWPDWTRRAFNLLFRHVVDFLAKDIVPGVKVVLATSKQTEKIRLADPEFLQMLRSNRLVIMTGWLAIEKIVLAHPETVRSFFAPTKEIADECLKVAIRARGDADILVGIHCRWGNYLDYAEGCFYFSVEAYLRVMRHCSGLFPNKRVAFLVISNEPEILVKKKDAFGPLRIAFGPNTLAGDLHSLAECDYIVYPASSYSLWAAFQGRKPVWCMRSELSVPELKDFSIYEHHFERSHPEVMYLTATNPSYFA